MKKIILWIATLLWMGVIWVLSSQDGTHSAALSNGFTAYILQNIIQSLTDNLDQQQTYFAFANYFTRECAHVFIYFVLGLLTALLAHVHQIAHKIALPFAFCVLFAFADEINQEFFTTGRSFQFIDLYKDWCGAILGISLILIVFKYRLPLKTRVRKMSQNF